MTIEWTKIGVVGVDSGQLVIMDPCYMKTVPHRLADKYPDMEPLWERYDERPIDIDDHQLTFQHKYDLGHDGLAVSFSGGHGDGEYEVFAKFRHGRVAEVKVVLIEEDDTDE